MAVAADSASRISPRKMTSGSCRRERRSPSAKVGVSMPTSRCVKSEAFDSKIYSPGSSIVTIWRRTDWLIASSAAATVVDFPDPVGPETMIIPAGRPLHSRSSSVGTPSVSNTGISRRILRRTAARAPSCRRRLTRKREPSGAMRLPSWSRAATLAPVRSHRSSRSASVSGGASIGVSSPSLLISAGRPECRIRSDAPETTATRRSSSINGDFIFVGEKLNRRWPDFFKRQSCARPFSGIGMTGAG